MENLLGSTNTILTISTSHWRSFSQTLTTGSIYIVAGDIDSINFAAGMTQQTSEVSGIPVGLLGLDRLLAKEFLGSTVRLYQIIKQPGDNLFTRDLLSTNILTNQTINGQAVTFELTAISAAISRPSPYYTSSNCLNSLGQRKCGFALTTAVRQEVVSVSNNGQTITLAAAPSGLSFLTNYRWEMVIGRSTYLINPATVAPLGPIINLIGSIQGQPKFVAVRQHCNLSFNQCGVYGQQGRFNGNLLLKNEGINVNL